MSPHQQYNTDTMNPSASCRSNSNSNGSSRSKSPSRNKSGIYRRWRSARSFNNNNAPVAPIAVTAWQRNRPKSPKRGMRRTKSENNHVKPKKRNSWEQDESTRSLTVDDSTGEEQLDLQDNNAEFHNSYSTACSFRPDESVSALLDLSEEGLSELDVSNLSLGADSSKRNQNKNKNKKQVNNLYGYFAFLKTMLPNPTSLLATAYPDAFARNVKYCQEKAKESIREANASTFARNVDYCQAWAKTFAECVETMALTFTGRTVTSTANTS